MQEERSIFFVCKRGGAWEDEARHSGSEGRGGKTTDQASLIADGIFASLFVLSFVRIPHTYELPPVGYLGMSSILLRQWRC